MISLDIASLTYRVISISLYSKISLYLNTAVFEYSFVRISLYVNIALLETRLSYSNDILPFGYRVLGRAPLLDGTFV